MRAPPGDPLPIRRARGHAMRLAPAAALIGLWATPTALAAHQATMESESYGSLTLRMITGLVFVSALAYAGLRWGVARRAAGGTPEAHGLAVLARLPIEPRRSILVIEAGEQRFLIGSSEQGLHALGEVDAFALEGEGSG